MGDKIQHYGILRRSGRYPWGTGEKWANHPTIRLYSKIMDLKEQGLSEKDISKKLGISTTDIRKNISIGFQEYKAARNAHILQMKERGHSISAIAKEFGMSESSILYALNPSIKNNNNIRKETVNILKNTLDKYDIVDVGKGVNSLVGVSQTMMNNVLEELTSTGEYKISYIYNGIGKNKQASKVLTKSDIGYSDIFKRKAEAVLPKGFLKEDTKKATLIEPAVPVNLDRIQISWKSPKDGLIELRRGVKDIDMGNAAYTQARVKAGDKHYLKGVCVYGNESDFKDGKDIIYHTNKSYSDDITAAMKSLSKHSDSPVEFGTVVRQKRYLDDDGKSKLSAINIVYEEGEWSKWSSTVATQMLSKQTMGTVRDRINDSVDFYKKNVSDISSVKNGAVRKKLYEETAGYLETVANDLTTLAFPGQSWNVLIPNKDIPVKGIYAPQYKTGTEVCLVRYPHASVHEIPRLIVNNSVVSARKQIGTAMDAVAINPKTAAQLSGADFDGDTVIVIPTTHTKISAKQPLNELVDFDPKIAYPKYENMKIMSEKQKGLEMGKISNLITDMSVKNASESEMVRAIKHSMVVIDAEKHELNFKQSEIDNGIAALKNKYQKGGASTLFSRAGSPIYVLEKDTYKDKDGNIKKLHSTIKLKNKDILDIRKNDISDILDIHINKPALNDAKKGNLFSVKGVGILQIIEEPNDNNNAKALLISKKSVPLTKKQRISVESAEDLSSGTDIEKAFVNYHKTVSNLKSYSEEQAKNIKTYKVNMEAKDKYSGEIQSINAKLLLIDKNKPYERKAVALATQELNNIKKTIYMDAAKERRMYSMLLDSSREKVHAKRVTPTLTDSEVEAINANAISFTKVADLFTALQSTEKAKFYGKSDVTSRFTASQKSLLRSLVARGLPLNDIAIRLNSSVSTIKQELGVLNADNS